MSAQIQPVKRTQDDVDRRVDQIVQANVAALTIMHGALHEIARAEISLNGVIGTKAIAERALIEVNNIAVAGGMNAKL